MASKAEFIGSLIKNPHSWFSINYCPTHAGFVYQTRISKPDGVDDRSMYIVTHLSFLDCNIVHIERNGLMSKYYYSTTFIEFCGAWYSCRGELSNIFIKDIYELTSGLKVYAH